ncbi:hypothetical protein LCGC14_2240050, partial [marine sediment metagenome]
MVLANSTFTKVTYDTLLRGGVAGWQTFETSLELGAEGDTLTMAFMVVGYMLGMIVIPRWLSQERALSFSAVLGVLITVLLINTNANSSALWEFLLGWTGAPALPNPVLYVALLGFANAMVWPAIWPLVLKGLSRKLTGTASALLIMSIAGGAILPVLYGVLAESSANPQGAYWIMIPCYLFILFYAV